MIFRIIWMR